MKRICICALALLFLGAGTGIAAPRRPLPPIDLSARVALYVTQGSVIDIAHDPIVSQNEAITVTRAQGHACRGSICIYNIGFIASRSNAIGSLSTYATLSLNGGIVGNTVYFAPGESTKQGVLPVPLRNGANAITFTIDPYGKIAESNEGNNAFSVTINAQVKP